MIIGITGSAGSGKSTVLGCFGRLGWELLDADRICAGLYERKDPRITGPIEERWAGRSVMGADGFINKKAVADIVFNDRDELCWLNALFHPLVFEEAAAVTARKPDSCRTAFDVPLLFEAKWEDSFDFTVCVWTREDIRVSRLLQRAWSREDIKKRTENQMPADEKLGKADFALINTGSVELLESQCLKISNYIERQLENEKENTGK